MSLLKNTCETIRQAQIAFRSMPNPPSVAGAAVHLYYCLNHVEMGWTDGTSRSTTMSTICVGQELFQLPLDHCEAQVSLEAIA